jgi:tRNA pseudouridine55 synthase
VRTLAEDIGEALGCGAHLVALRRTGVGALTLEHAVTLDALSMMEAAARDAMLQPVDALLSTFVAVRLSHDEARRFQQGQRLRLADLPPIESGVGARVRVYRVGDGALLGVARAENGVLAPERLVMAGGGGT